MKLLTRWQTWFVKGREEFKFHNDMILEPGETILLLAPGRKELLIHSPDKFAKVHISFSWEYRDTEFVDE